jgi:hypothetical protein
MVMDDVRAYCHNYTAHYTLLEVYKKLWKIVLLTDYLFTLIYSYRI